MRHQVARFVAAAALAVAALLPAHAQADPQVSAGCIYEASITTPPINQIAAPECTATRAIYVHNDGSFASTGGGGSGGGYPYTGLLPQPQATSPSFSGFGGTYNSAGVTATNGQFVPAQFDSAGNLDVNVRVGGGSGGGAGPVSSPGVSATAAGAIQGVTGGVPVAVTGVPTPFVFTPPPTQTVNGTVTVTGAPTPIAYTSAAPIPATIVNQPATYPITTSTTLPVAVQNAIALAAGSATIGSIANTAFGITGSLPAGANTIGAVNINGTVPVSGAFPTPIAYTSASPLPVTVVNPSAGGGGTTCSYPSPQPTYAPGATGLGLTCDTAANLNVRVQGGTVNVPGPYSLVSQGQTAQSFSGWGALGVYNSTPTTLTTGQAAPIQLTLNGALLSPYNAALNSQPLQPGTFSGMGGTDGTNFEPWSVTSNGYGRVAPCSSSSTLCQTIGAPNGDGLSPSTASGAVYNFNYAYNGTAYDREYKDTYAAGPQWMSAGGSTVVPLTTSASIKASPGRIVGCVQTATATVAGVGMVYNNTAASGTAILYMPVATALTGTMYTTNMPASTALYWGNTATGGGVTCSYF